MEFKDFINNIIEKQKESNYKIEKQKECLRVEKENLNNIMKSKPSILQKDKVNGKSECVNCPKCGGTQLTANKKGFSLGKALVGGFVLVPIAGVATGMLGKNKIIITCLSCGKQFKPGR